MRCTRARAYIAHGLDGPLASREAAALERHLHGCEGCRVYKAEMQDLAVSMSADALSIAGSLSLSADFCPRLRTALLREYEARERSVGAAVDRLVATLESKWSSLPVLLARAAAAMAAGVAAVVLAAIAVGQVQQPAADYRFGHLASFSARSQPDGRVYASIERQGSLGRQDLREGYLR